jgi:hypothetical protein
VRMTGGCNWLRTVPSGGLDISIICVKLPVSASTEIIKHDIMKFTVVLLRSFVSVIEWYLTQPMHLPKSYPNLLFIIVLILSHSSYTISVTVYTAEIR